VEGSSIVRSEAEQVRIPCRRRVDEVDAPTMKKMKK
jgi:hypothetical protein